MADNLTQNGIGLVATDGIVTLNGATVPEVQAQRVKPGFGVDGTFQDVTPTNGFPVNQVSNSLVSTANSSAVALALNAAFTGTSEDISEYSTIMVTVFADQASALDGLSIQQSSNGTNWDLSDIYTVPASSGKTFSTGVQAKFFRIVYTNGATASTVMRLQTIYSKASKKNSSVRPQDGRTNDNDFEENMAFGMVYNAATNTWDRMRGNSANGLNVTQTDIASTGSITTVNLVPAGVATAGSAVELTLVNAASLSIQVTGTYTGALSLQATIDGSNWITIGGTPLINVNTGGYLASITSALQSIFQAECSGFIKVRITALAAVTGSATVSLRAVMGAAMVALDASIPTGANVIGAVTGSGSFVTGGLNAQGSASSGNPVMCAGFVQNAVTTTLTSGTVSRLALTTSAQLSVKPYGLPENDWQYASAAGGIIVATDVVVKAAGAAGIRNYITGIDLRNSHATVATEVVIKDGAVVIWRGQLPVNSPTVDIGFATPLKGTAATAINVQCITTGASVFVNLQGYIGN